MFRGSFVTIEASVSLENEYVIKDKFGITIGRISIIELSKENKYCCFRLKFYKGGDLGYLSEKETIELFIEKLFNSMNINKVSVVIDEELNTKPFVELEFQLEGIISNSIIINGLYRDEILLGIDYNIFKNRATINVLRFKGKRIDIKVLIPNDTKDILDYYKRNKTHLMQFEPTREENFFTFEAQRQIIIENHKQFLNGTGVTFGIYISNKFIGKIQISGVIFGVFKSAFIGYSIDEKEQGFGYMKEALSMVMDYAFKNMELHRIEASTLIDNEKSQGVLTALGFEKLGINKKYLFINGKWRDHLTFYKVSNN